MMVEQVGDMLYKFGRMALAAFAAWLVKDMVTDLHAAGVDVNTITVLVGLVVAVPTTYIGIKGKGYQPPPKE